MAPKVFRAHISVSSSVFMLKNEGYSLVCFFIEKSLELDASLSLN